MKTFGQFIREARLKKGLTLEKVASRIRTHKGYISGIEGGKVSQPSRRFIGGLCRLLDLPETGMAALAHAEKAPVGPVRDSFLKFVELEYFTPTMQIPEADDGLPGGITSTPQIANPNLENAHAG